MTARPTAAKGRFPFAEHRRVAQIDGAAERMRRMRAVQLAWCPVDRRDDYLLLSRHLGAAEARATILQSLGRD